MNPHLSITGEDYIPVHVREVDFGEYFTNLALEFSQTAVVGCFKGQP
jgi:hypothetical protein